MKRSELRLAAAVAAAAVLMPVHVLAATPARTISPATSAHYGKLPISFEANEGQSNAQVRFTSRTSGYTLFLTDSEAVVAFHAGGSLHNGATFRMQLAGANPSVKLSGAEPLPGVVNYFVGSDPAKWRSSIPTYGKVRYSSVYPGIDLVYYGNERQLEYDFLVAPQADAAAIRLKFAATNKLSLDAEGDLQIADNSRTIAFHKPRVFQKGDRGDQSIAGQFQLLADNTVTFKLGRYDRTLPLVIDPILSYSTFLGGNNGDSGNAIAVDSSGNAYIAGVTYSMNFPTTTGAYQTKDRDTITDDSAAFVTKLNAAGTALVYSTYLGGAKASSNSGGTASSQANGIAVDSEGDAYIGGFTSATDFPISTGAYESTLTGGQGGFVTKLNPTGTKLVYSTYLGITNLAAVSAIALDSSGNAYVTGWTFGGFPTTTGAYQATYPGKKNNTQVAFASEVNPTGTKLVFSTYLGGSGNANNRGDWANAIALGPSGEVLVAGGAYSTNFPVSTKAFQGANKAGAKAADDGFVTEFNSTGTSLIYSTYLGGSGNSSNHGDYVTGLAVDSDGSAYVTGIVRSANFPTTTNAYQARQPGLTNAFATKLNPAGTALDYSTYFGGSNIEDGFGIAIDSEGNAYLTGLTGSADFPVTPGAIQSTNTAVAASAPVGYFAELNPSGSELLYSTMLGGSGINDGSGAGDGLEAIALDGSGNVYLTGNASSANFPTTVGAYQTKNNGPLTGDLADYGTGVVSKIALNIAATATTVTSSANPQTVGLAVTFTATVTPGTGTATASGNVAFSVDSKVVATTALSNGGKATYTTSSLAAGTHTVSAAYAGATGFAASTSAKLTETIQQQAAKPAISPAAGAVTFPISVTISDTTTGAKIYYTTNKTTPTAGSTPYTKAFSVTAAETIEAIAIAPGYTNSVVASAAYTKK